VITGTPDVAPVTGDLLPSTVGRRGAGNGSRSRLRTEEAPPSPATSTARETAPSASSPPASITPIAEPALRRPTVEERAAHIRAMARAASRRTRAGRRERRAG
jgi:hypothetical protein